MKLLLYFYFLNFNTIPREGKLCGAVCSYEPETLGEKLINLLAIVEIKMA